MKKRKRLKTKVEKVLEVLSDGRWHNSGELVSKAGLLFCLAIHDLLFLGCAIARRRHPCNYWIKQYRWQGIKTHIGKPTGRQRRVRRYCRTISSTS